MSNLILTEEELSEISNGFHRGLVTPEDAHNLIASHRQLIAANAELSFKNNELKQEKEHLSEEFNYKSMYAKQLEEDKFFLTAERNKLREQIKALEELK
jgi:hypothetical protein